MNIQYFQILEAADLSLILIILKLAISLFAIWIGYRFVRSYISRVGERLRIEEHVLNFIRLAAKTAFVWLALMAAVQILGLPTDWFVGASALVGTAIGFGSTQTIGNFLAGLYILVTRPFTVKDFVKIGDVEGQVEEITINYTMMYVMTRNLVKIPNVQILNSKITHFTKEGVVDYSFRLYFDHSLTNERITDNVLEPAIEEFQKKHGKNLVDRPKHYLIDADQGRKAFSIRLFFKKGDARSFYNLKPVLLRMILDHYYDEKNREVR